MNEVLDLLKETQAVLADSHFVGTSGRHIALYINKDALYPHAAKTSRIGELFAEKNKNIEVEVVVGPALGGIILSTWTAYHLSNLKNKEILGIYTEKDENKKQVLRRGYDKLVKGKKVLIVEDLTTTGGSVKEVINSVQRAGGEVTQACVMVNRDPGRVNSETIGVPFYSLAVLEDESWDEAECPLCKQNIPINTTVGHGKQFLEQKNKK